MKMQSSVSQSEVRGDGAAASAHIIASAKKNLSDEYQNFLCDIEDLIKATTSLTGEELAHAKTLLNARILEAKQSVEKMGGVVADKARNTAKATDSYVHENPWQAIGIGAALGVIIGVVVARR